MNVVIVGANFGNKGAQSMLFTTVAALRRSYPDAKIFFAHGNESPCLDENFLFGEIHYNHRQIEIAADRIKFVAPGKNSWCPPQKTFETFANADLIIDISGFALGNKWGVQPSLAYLNHTKFARALEVPIILMPQSFGDFNFGDAQEFMDAQIIDTLVYPKKIFARERDGYLPLRGRYGLKNVFLHADIVLSSPPVKPAEIYKSPPKISVPKILDASCVGVVPNLRAFDHGGKPWQTLQAYYEIINFLLSRGKIVYLFRHSREDIYPCSWLKSLFVEDGRVVLWKNNFSCFEYDAVCRQFDFLIVGRFHGIVHAYRNNVPCLLMGWAVKYRELAQLMYQSRYIFDLSAANLDTREIFSAIDDMQTNLALNKKILRERLTQVQAGNSCFKAAAEILAWGGGLLVMKISSVVENTLCVACGICAGVCPKKCISSTFAAGNCQPTIDENSCDDCGLCHKVCPGKSATYTGENIFFGRAIKNFAVQAKDEQILARATSGGAITVLVKNLLRDKIYDAAFLVDTYNHDAETFTNRYTADDDLTATQKSRYVTVNQSRAISYMLANRDAKLILVGTSCFIQGVLNVIAQFKLNRENYFLAGLFCDKTMNYNIWKYFKSFGAEKVHFRTKEIGGWPGDVALESHGEKLYLPRIMRVQMKDFFCVERCLYCLDKLNQFADISFGDNYCETPLPEQMNRAAGTSCLIVRTERGAEIFDRYREEFFTHELKAADISDSQNLNERVKNFIFGEYKSAQVGYSINNVPPETSMLITENSAHRRQYESLLAKQKIGREKNFPYVAVSVWQTIS